MAAASSSNNLLFAYYDIICRLFKSNHLIKSATIRSINALVLCLLFVLSNTPKKVVHGIFADHVDQKKNLSTLQNGENLVQLNFHCQVDNLVVESPFISSIHTFSFFISKQYLEFALSLYQHAPAVFQSSFQLRGPPSVC